jgi:hypothetical protein
MGRLSLALVRTRRKLEVGRERQGTLVDTPFHITDTHVDYERGPVLEWLTKNQAATLKKYLVKMQAKIDQLKREAHRVHLKTGRR